MTATRFRKKPVEIEAIQWTGDNIDAVMGFMHPQVPVHVNELSHMRFTNADDLVGIETLEGLMVANKGDWIIRGVQSELYPCKPDIFAATYEVAVPGTASAEQRAEAASRLGTRYMVRAERAEAAIEGVRALADGWACTGRDPNACIDMDAAAEAVHTALGQPPGPAAAETTEAEKTTRVFAALHRSAEQDVTRVIALYEQWVKAGWPPLGTPLSRWWDARLVELHDAILPPADATKE